MGSVGQRAAKLLAVNVGGLKKKSAIRPRPHLSQSARVRTQAKSNHSQNLIAGNFAALWPTDPKFSALKDLNFFKKCTNNQEASSILRVGFALSKWPHLYRVYLLGVWHWSSETGNEIPLVNQPYCPSSLPLQARHNGWCRVPREFPDWHFVLIFLIDTHRDSLLTELFCHFDGRERSIFGFKL